MPACLASVGGAGAPPDVSSPATTSVPIELLNDHIYLSATVDGRGPYRFLLDSGATLLLDRGVARRIGAPTDGSFAISGFGRGTARASFVRIDALRIGDATISRVRGTAFDAASYFREIEDVPDAVGIIGYELFARFVATVDFAHRRLTLARPVNDAPPPAGTAVPFVLDGTTPVVAGTLDGVATTFSIDTGSRAPLQIFTRFLDAHPALRAGVATRDGIVGYGVGGPAYAALGRPRSFVLGTLPVKAPITAYGTRLAGVDASSRLGGNVGSQILQRFTVVFDYPHRRIVFAPGSGAPAFDRSGLFLAVHGPAVVALDVRPGTPAAAAGIRPGETIVAVDGEAARAVGLPTLRARLADPARVETRLRVRSAAGLERDVVLALREYVYARRTVSIAGPARAARGAARGG